MEEEIDVYRFEEKTITISAKGYIDLVDRYSKLADKYSDLVDKYTALKEQLTEGK